MQHRWLPRLTRRRARLAVLLVLSLTVTPVALAPAEPHDAPWHLPKGFRNLDSSYNYTLGGRAWSLLRGSLTSSPPRGTPPARVANDGAELRANGTHPTVTWIGHATLLVQLAGVNILTDPNWGERASPVGFAGPRRLIAPGMRVRDLPPIHTVVISHDHYDHLDADTVVRLDRAFHPKFFVPLGLKAWLGDLGITNVVEMDWWESQPLRGLTFTCTPAH